MKKLLAIALALVLIYALSVTAMAENITLTPPPSPDSTITPPPPSGETTVTFNVAPSYTVTIPKTVELSKDPADGKYKQDATIAAENVRLLVGQTLNVTLTSDFTMDAGSTTWNYTVVKKVGNSTTNITTGAIVATFNSSTTAQPVTLHFEAENPIYAGEYTDTVTFTLSVGNANNAN